MIKAISVLCVGISETKKQHKKLLLYLVLSLFWGFQVCSLSIGIKMTRQLLQVQLMILMLPWRTEAAIHFLLQGRCGYWQLPHNICCLSSALSFLLSQNSGKAMEMRRHLNGSGGGPQWHLLCLPKHISMMSCLNSPGKYLLNSIVDT